MHVCIYTHLYIHVDLSNINVLCLGGGTRCTKEISMHFD